MAICTTSTSAPKRISTIPASPRTVNLSSRTRAKFPLVSTMTDKLLALIILALCLNEFHAEYPIVCVVTGWDHAVDLGDTIGFRALEPSNINVNGGIRVTLTHGDSCHHSPNRRKTEVTMQCDMAVSGTGLPVAAAQGIETTHCEYDFAWKTRFQQVTMMRHVTVLAWNQVCMPDLQDGRNIHSRC